MCLAYLNQCLPFSSWISHQVVISWSYEWMLWSVICFTQVLAVVETPCFLVSTVGIRIHLCWTSWVTQRSCRNETSRKCLYFTFLMLIFKMEALKANLILKKIIQQTLTFMERRLFWWVEGPWFWLCPDEIVVGMDSVRNSRFVYTSIWHICKKISLIS